MLCGLAAFAALACSPISAREASALPDCWSLTFAALKHRAVSAHPPYIAYVEAGSISEDQRTLMRMNPSVVYRDDGVLRISEDGFTYLTRTAEPGPPELGPYGERRSVWLPIEDAPDPALPLIGSVRTRSTTMTCANEGIENLKEHQTYRLVFTTQHPDRPSLRALWVDTRTSEIWKVIVSGPTPVAVTNDRSQPLADFEIELAQVGNYVVVNHITWKLSYHQFWQTTKFFGEYYFSAFAFPTDVPAGFFHT